MGQGLAAHRYLAGPHLLGLRRDKVGDFGRNVARGDGVCAGELDPFDGERFACS